MEWISKATVRGAINFWREGKCIIRQTVVLFNDSPILVRFHGSDERQIPPLLSALKNNKISFRRMHQPPSHVDLYGTEALIHLDETESYRIPLF
jgi:hypothetical protein